MTWIKNGRLGYDASSRPKVRTQNAVIHRYEGKDIYKIFYGS